MKQPLKWRWIYRYTAVNRLTSNRVWWWCGYNLGIYETIWFCQLRGWIE